MIEVTLRYYAKPGDEPRPPDTVQLPIVPRQHDQVVFPDGTWASVHNARLHVATGQVEVMLWQLEGPEAEESEEET